MEWLEVRIATNTTGTQHVEAVLVNAGVGGWQTFDEVELSDFLQNNPLQWDYVDENLFTGNTDAMICFYVTDNATGRETLDCVTAAVRGLAAERGDCGPLDISVRRRDDAEWHDAWAKYYKPIDVGTRVVIKPAWETYDNVDNKVVIVINPGHVFGTGQHETTRMCIEAIETHMQTGCTVLDVGCGSGILSIAALLLGAGACTAIDFDPNAREIVNENARLNRVNDRLRCHTGDALRDASMHAMLKAGGYGCVVANITADAIILLSKVLNELSCLMPGGLFIASGIIRERLEETLRAVEGAGHALFETRIDGEWAALCARRL